MCQVVLRHGVAIDAEVPDYSELDTVPNERRYTADQPSPVPSEPPSMPHPKSPDDVPDSVPDLTSGAKSAGKGMMLFVLCKPCERLDYSILQVFRQHPAATCFQVAQTFLTLTCSS